MQTVIRFFGQREILEPHSARPFSRDEVLYCKSTTLRLDRIEPQKSKHFKICQNKVSGAETFYMHH